jgi:3-deoxy-D-manno-octulosonic-acid transferase
MAGTDPITPRRGPLERTRLGPVLRVKRAIFRLIERAANSRSPTASRTATAARESDASLWIFVSTIGELNAIEPFLIRLLAQPPHRQVVLLTDRSVYRDAYLHRYPDALVIEIAGADARELATALRPALFIVAEIPCRLSDAPCRLPFAFPYEAKRAGAAVCLINGWLYGQAPASRIDALERSWFGKDYLRIFDAITVQTDDMARTLIDEGAAAERTSVTGNIKFDAIASHREAARTARSAGILRGIRDSARPCIVAGCVTDEDEQVRIVEAFAGVKRELDHPLLVIAPRHPENAEMMRILDRQLKLFNVSFRLRSEIRDDPLASSLDCLVLDTMGELRDFYAAATVAYVGRDHNLLEPLAFEKPVYVGPGWDARYPSYPVYSMLLAQGALIEAAAASALTDSWLTLLRDPASYGRQREMIDTVLARNQGATERCLEALGSVRQ